MNAFERIVLAALLWTLGYAVLPHTTAWWFWFAAIGIILPPLPEKK